MKRTSNSVSFRDGARLCSEVGDRDTFCSPFRWFSMLVLLCCWAGSPKTLCGLLPPALSDAFGATLLDVALSGRGSELGGFTGGCFSRASALDFFGASCGDTCSTWALDSLTGSSFSGSSSVHSETRSKLLWSSQSPPPEPSEIESFLWEEFCECLLFELLASILFPVSSEFLCYIKIKQMKIQ